MEEYENEKELIEYLDVIWRKKWLIIFPTVLIAIAVAVVSLILPEVWEVDSILSPSKFLTQTAGGQFEEVIVTSPSEIASQINEGVYNNLIAAQLNIDPKKFPKLSASPIKDTNLIQIKTKVEDVDKAKNIQNTLFSHLKADLDKKIDVEMKSIDSAIEARQSEIKQKELQINDIRNGFKLLNIEKAMTLHAVESAKNKTQISEQRAKNIVDELENVKKKSDELSEQVKEIMAGVNKGLDAVSLLLYSNEVQANLRYYDTLNEKHTYEMITQENLDLEIKSKREELKKLDTQIDNLKNNVEKSNTEIENIRSNIQLLSEEKMRIDYARLVKEPTSSVGPVAPKKMQMVLIAGFVSGFMFLFLAFFLTYIEESKKKQRFRREEP
ncbi:MAG: Wzz/FepE/Etk N-terminal domain-containing protein [bacterium]